MIAAGVPASDAGALAAEIYSLGVASASVRSPGAERTRRWRENQASHRDGLRHETSPRDTEAQASQTVTERHKPSQCDADTVSPIDTKIKNSKRQNSDRASRGTRLASDWTPSPEDRALASQEGFSESEINREALRFRDYWIGRAGSGGVKLDWPATWRNWIRTSGEKLGKTPKAPENSAQVIGSDFYAKFGSEEQDAWDRYGQANRGKTFPRDRNGGWRFPTQWPPGYQPRTETNEVPPAPILKEAPRLLIIGAVTPAMENDVTNGHQNSEVT